MELLQFKEKCIKHKIHNIEYIKINKKQSCYSKSLFYCQECFNSDSTFNLNDYLQIKDLTTNSLDKIIKQWPPVNDQEIIDLLMKITSDEYSFDETINKVNSFFKYFRQSINDQIDKCYKQYIKYVEDHQFNKKEIINKYEEISKINELISYLLNNQTNLQEKEKQCYDFIQQSHSQEYENTINLENLLKENNSKNIFDSESALEIQQSILKSIENIELFQQPIPNMELNLEFLKTDYNEGQTLLSVSYNYYQQQQIKLIQQNDDYQNAVSDLILKSNKKYIFRFQIDKLEIGNTIYIGLIQDANKNIQEGRSEYLCCRLKNKGQFITKDQNYGIYKQLKGDEFKLGENKQLEMRVCIAENTLEMLDYPKYNYKIGLDDQYISNLINAINLRVYLGFAFTNNQITLTEAKMVKQFE